MGKGIIISGGDKGQYTIDIVYNSDAYDREIALLDQQITDLQTKYDNAPDETAKDQIAKSILKLQLTSLNKRKENLQAAYSESTEKTVWCADLTEDLTGEVGTVEVPGESINMQIQPGYNNNAKYDSNRDGQLQKSYNMDYAGLFYNLAMLPGWQKWKPLFRYGTITAINNKLADVTLEDIKSSQQAISINQTNMLTGVKFEYMTCDDAAFTEGDEVLIKFENQDWTKPKIVGFKDNPKLCGGYLYVSNGDLCFVWDLETNTYASGIKDNNGEEVTFPVSQNEISDYLSNFSQVGIPAISVKRHSVEDPNPGNGDVLATDEWVGCLFSEVEWNISDSKLSFTPGGEEYKEYTYYHNKKNYWTQDYLGNVRIDSIEITDPVYSKNFFKNYKITSNTNISQVKGRSVSSEYSYFCKDTKKILDACTETMDGLPYAACSQMGDRGIEESRELQESTEIKTYSPFSDSAIQNIELNQDIDISSSASGYCYIGPYGTPYPRYNDLECHVNTQIKNVKYSGYNASGVIGNEALPYVIVFYIELVKTQIITNDKCGYFPIQGDYGYSPWRYCMEDNSLSCDDLYYGNPPCNPNDSNKIITQVEVCELKAFSAKDINGDPMNLNPFELPQNTNLQAAMKELYDKNTLEYIPNISMSFLQ